MDLLHPADTPVGGASPLSYFEGHGKVGGLREFHSRSRPRTQGDAHAYSLAQLHPGRP